MKKFFDCPIIEKDGDDIVVEYKGEEIWRGKDLVEFIDNYAEILSKVGSHKVGKSSL